MNNVTDELFESIKKHLTEKPNKMNAAYQHILKLEVHDKPYIVRIIPNLSKPNDTFKSYISWGWISYKTGKYMSLTSPTYTGDADIIAAVKYPLLKTGTDEQKEKAKNLKRNEYFLANVYVVDDPKNPKNNGQVKILRFKKQLHKIIMDAISGDSAEEYGSRIFDFTKNGCNLSIKVEKNDGGYNSYNSSRFKMPSDIPGMTDAKREEVFSQAHDLNTVIDPVKPSNEIHNILNEHFFAVNVATSIQSVAPTSDEQLAEEQIKKLLEEVNQ